ncbi:MAG TPA: hypothetical protein VGE52_10810, partial [Pirellulales bacterium]
PDGELKNALQVHRTAILAALARRGHVDAVVGAVKRSPGKFDPVNDTPESLRKALGGDLPAFDSLIAVDLAMPNVGPHAHREVDPYDAAFFEHLGQIDTLESLNIIATKLNDDWIVPLNRLHKLKTLKFTNNGKLTDAGLEKLSGLTQLESFSFVGTKMQGHAFAKFEGWTKLTRSSFRGSSLDDAGLQFLCERFPNYESLSLAHAHFTDAGAVHLAKLTKLKGLELGSREATPNCLQAITTLSLEYLQLGDGLDAPTGIALIKDMPTLRRLTLTDASALTDDNLKLVSEMKQLEQLELGRPAMPAERLELMKDFGFLKSLRLTPGREPLAPETQERLHAALPKTELKFQ